MGESELDKWFEKKEQEDYDLIVNPVPEEEYAPNWIKKKGEQWTRDYLKKIFGIYTEKRSDAPWETPKGDIVYPKRGVDFFGSVPSPSIFSYHLELEVKAFTGSFSLSNIKKHQAEALSEAANRGDIAILSLVKVGRPSQQVETMWWIPWPPGYPDHPQINIKVADGGYSSEFWPHTWAWFMAELRKRATGNFQAKSIREQDLELLDEWKIEKEKNTWMATTNHWLAHVTGNWGRVMQRKLL